MNAPLAGPEGARARRRWRASPCATCAADLPACASFSLCIALGVAAIVGVESLAKALDDGLGAPGAGHPRRRRLVLADPSPPVAGRTGVSRALRRALDHRDHARDGADRERRRGAGRGQGGRAVLADDRRGRVRAADVARRRRSRNGDGVFGAAAEETLLARLNLKVGDAFRLGEAKFVLRAVVTSEPDRLAVGVGLGPRVLISQAALNATGLVQPGSLVRWTTRVVMGGPGGAPDEAAVKALIERPTRRSPRPAGRRARASTCRPTSPATSTVSPSS